VQELFEEQDWVVERPEADATVLRIPVAGDAGDFELWVRTDEAEQLVTVYAVLPTDVPAPRVAEVLELAARLNQSVPVGSYEADPESGLLSFKTAIDVAGDRLSPALVERLVATAMAAATRGHAALDGLLADQ
jgi:hypothetical protein